MRKIVLSCLSHAAAIAIGFAAGIYALPILIAPVGPANTDVASLQKQARFKGEFRRSIKGSDFFHWGEGTVTLDNKAITLMGKIAPGPDYKLYLVPEFVDSKEAFLRAKTSALRVGDVKTFDNFIVPLGEGVDLAKYTTVLVWCETFSMFITAASYRE